MTARAGRLVVRCPAKVNLHLEVLGRRPDGYHEVRTLLAAVGVWDTLIMEPGDEGVGLEVRPAGVAPAGEDNLVVRAARQLQRRSGTRLGARLILHKRIPVAGGMGGGSSNAAAALVGLNQLWGLGAGLAELQAMASALGADVPFFLLGGVAWARAGEMSYRRCRICRPGGSFSSPGQCRCPPPRCTPPSAPPPCVRLLPRRYMIV